MGVKKLAQNIHANKGWCDMHANQLSQTTCSSEYSNGQAAVFIILADCTPL